VFAVDEKTIHIGSFASWELIEKRQGIIEASQIRPNPVLVLSSAIPANAMDLHLSFDESQAARFSDSRGNYKLSVSPSVSATPFSRAGSGAALFSGKANDDAITLLPQSSALFSPGTYVRDFSIEFWLFPQNLESGEQILLWSSSKNDGAASYLHQRILCVASKNKLQWTFTDLFFSPGEKARKSLTLSGSAILNRTWSHHLIRFDADIGLLEYLVDGRVEALEYLTASGREGGEVFTPVIGENCRLSLGNRFSGMMDEFNIYNTYLENPVLVKYPQKSGRLESRTLDLGFSNSRILLIEAFGGRTEGLANSSRHQYMGNEPLRFTDHGEIRFFVRYSNSSYQWNDVPWIPFNPGEYLADVFRGRFIQLAADFYPGWNGEASPYLSEIKIVFRAAEPPPPPRQLIAMARDGAVELSWKASPSRDVEGYLVYYGTARGEYFGCETVISPINAGNHTSIKVEGLKNGTLYYFAVAAYRDIVTGLHDPGEFSREVAARPLRMAE